MPCYGRVVQAMQTLTAPATGRLHTLVSSLRIGCCPPQYSKRAVLYPPVPLQCQPSSPLSIAEEMSQLPSAWTISRFPTVAKMKNDLSTNTPLLMILLSCQQIIRTRLELMGGRMVFAQEVIRSAILDRAVSTADLLRHPTRKPRNMAGTCPLQFASDCKSITPDPGGQKSRIFILWSCQYATLPRVRCCSQNHATWVCGQLTCWTGCCASTSSRCSSEA